MSTSQTSRLDAGPAALVAGAGALTIALASNGGRSSHLFWLTAVLAESAVAVLYRRRHPLVSLGAILAAYIFFDYLPLVLLPVFLTLAAIAVRRRERVTFGAGIAATATFVAAPALHGDPLDPTRVLLPLGVMALAVAAGSFWRAHA